MDLTIEKLQSHFANCFQLYVDKCSYRTFQKLKSGKMFIIKKTIFCRQYIKCIAVRNYIKMLLLKIKQQNNVLCLKISVFLKLLNK